MNCFAAATSNSARTGRLSASNLVILTENPGADAAFFGANDSAASFRMATQSKSGEKEYVEWHPVVAFRELAKEVVEKCTKGRFIRVYGYYITATAETMAGSTRPK